MEQPTQPTEAAGQLTQTLLQFSAAAGVPPDVMPDLIAAAVLRAHRCGDILFRENAISDELLLVISGSIALEMNVPGRGNIRILSLGPGDLVGWSALLGGGQMTTSAVVLVDTQIAVFSARDINALCERNHSFGYHVMRHLAKALANRLVATRLQLLDLFSDSRPIGSADQCST